MSPREGEGVLFLRLEGPLQSWGDNARWVVRGTRLEPTKSGVLGMIACAFGWGLNVQGDERIARLATQVRLGVRADREGVVIRDYHTVCGGGLSAEGKIKRTASTGEPETVVSERYYLADARFLVALAGPMGVLTAIVGALRDPVWPVFLGRKSCPPTVPVCGKDCLVAGDGEPDLERELRRRPWLGRKGERAPEQLRAIVELGPAEEARDAAVQTRRDVPLSLTGRRFGARRVREVHFEPRVAREG